MVKRPRVAAPSGDAYEDPMERIKAFQARMFNLKDEKPSVNGSGAGRPADEVPMVQWKRSKAKHSTGSGSVDPADAIPKIGIKAKSSKEKKHKTNAAVAPAAKSKVVQVPGAPIVAANAKSKISTPATSTLKVIKKKDVVTAKAPISKTVAPIAPVSAPVTPYVEIGEDPLKLAMQSVQAKMQALEKKKQNSRFAKPLPKPTKKLALKKKKAADPEVTVPEASDAAQEDDSVEVEVVEAKPTEEPTEEKATQVSTAISPLTGKKHALEESEQPTDAKSKRKKPKKRDGAVKKAEDISITMEEPAQSKGINANNSEKLTSKGEGSSARETAEDDAKPTSSILVETDAAAKSMDATSSGETVPISAVASKNSRKKKAKQKKKQRAQARKLSISSTGDAPVTAAVASVQSENKQNATATISINPPDTAKTFEPEIVQSSLPEKPKSAQALKSKQTVKQSAKPTLASPKSATIVAKQTTKPTSANSKSMTTVVPKPKEDDESGNEESSDEEHDDEGGDFSQYQNQIYAGLIDQAAREEWELLEVGRLVRLFAAEWQYKKKKTARFLRRFCPELVSVDFMEGLNINLTAGQLLKILQRGSGNPAVLANKMSSALENGHLSVRDTAFLSFMRKKLSSLPTNEVALEFLAPLLESLSTVRDVGRLLKHVCEHWHIERTKALVQQILLTPIFDDLDGNQDEILDDMPYLEGKLDFPSRMDQEDADENGNLIGFFANEDSDLGEEDAGSELDAEEALGEIHSEADEDDDREDDEDDEDEGGEGEYEGETDSEEEETHLQQKRRPLRMSQFVLDEAEEGDEDEEEDESEEEIEDDDDDSQDSSDSDDSDNGKARNHRPLKRAKTRKVFQQKSR